PTMPGSQPVPAPTSPPPPATLPTSQVAAEASLPPSLRVASEQPRERAASAGSIRHSSEARIASGASHDGRPQKHVVAMAQPRLQRESHTARQSDPPKRAPTAPTQAVAVLPPAPAVNASSPAPTQAQPAVIVASLTPSPKPGCQPYVSNVDFDGDNI